MKRCKVKQLTETEPFSFESDERSDARKNDEAVQDEVGRETALAYVLMLMSLVKLGLRICTFGLMTSFTQMA